MNDLDTSKTELHELKLGVYSEENAADFERKMDAKRYRTIYQQKRTETKKEVIIEEIRRHLERGNYKTFRIPLNKYNMYALLMIALNQLAERANRSPFNVYQVLYRLYRLNAQKAKFTPKALKMFELEKLFDRDVRAEICPHCQKSFFEHDKLFKDNEVQLNERRFIKIPSRKKLTDEEKRQRNKERCLAYYYKRKQLKQKQLES